MFSLKRFSKQKVKRLGKEAQVLKEKNLIKSLNPSACVPQVLCTCADRTHAGILLNACLACPLASILHTALDESSARFCAASVVIALEDLHKVYCSEVFILFQQLPFCLNYNNFFNPISLFLVIQNGVLYRGVSPDVLMLDQTGFLQVCFLSCYYVPKINIMEL